MSVADHRLTSLWADEEGAVAVVEKRCDKRVKLFYTVILTQCFNKNLCCIAIASQLKQNLRHLS